MTVLKIEDVSKLYRLGLVGSRTFKEDIKRFIAKTRGKKDPFQNIGAENDRTKAGNDDFVWALKDINLEVKQGEILGVIGRNGAGKTTLLKLLSKVTKPTTGSIKVKGRIASLLEVGTGFHPELTGRENIFLNGAILGMSKAEIRSKLDEIVDFAGIEKYLDTPTKRYSSGMTVRLGFAVAAYLEPDILIVDEVLAVGDAEFQKKAIGKMQDVSNKQGRTVLFVSHNMTSIRSLCKSAIMLNHGMVHSIGETSKIISNYLKINRKDDGMNEFEIPSKLSLYSTGEAKFKTIKIVNSKELPSRKLYFKEEFTIELTLDVVQSIENVIVNLFILNVHGEKIVTFSSGMNFKPRDFNSGKYTLSLNMNQILMPGEYSICIAMSYFQTGSAIDFIESVYPFEIDRMSTDGKIEYPWVTVNGYVYPSSLIKVNRLNEN